MKITAVGGYKAVGRNMTGITLGEETVAIDNGIRLDTMQMYDEDPNILKKRNVDELVRMSIIPDAKILKNVVAQVISHGHLDHIGALGITEPEVPIITTPYAAEIGKKEYKKGNFYSLDYNEEFQISTDMSVELIEVTHSIPNASIVVLHTPEGDIVYASDFRFDNDSTIAKPDYKQLKKIGQGNVRALIAESTRVTQIGKTPSEAIVRNKLKDIIGFIEDGLIIATTFATHIERVQAIVDEVEKSGRIPLIMGRSLHTQTELAKRFDLLDLPSNAIVLKTPKAIKKALGNIKKRDDYFLLVTGHQGEPQSVLSKLINNKFNFKLKKGDSVIFCANVIPTPINRASRHIVETRLKSIGVRIFEDVHVSGHASKEDHRQLIKLVKPEHIIPCHGGIEMRSGYVDLGIEEGYELNKNMHLLTNGLSVTV